MISWKSIIKALANGYKAAGNERPGERRFGVSANVGAVAKAIKAVRKKI